MTTGAGLNQDCADEESPHLDGRPPRDNLRPLPRHLSELALACHYLGNEATNGASTPTISKWLALAGDLRSVDVDTARFDWESLYCDGPQDYWRASSAHYSRYSTAIARFVFVGLALEETYRFVEPNYHDSVRGKPDKSVRRASIKAALLVDGVSVGAQPQGLVHFGAAYKRQFEAYAKTRRDAKLSGMEWADEASPGYALHLVRNLRNDVVHGDFPLMPPSDYDYDTIESAIEPAPPYADDLILLVEESTRMAALYMQTLIAEFAGAFESREYAQVTCIKGPEAQWFMAGCTRDYLTRLHLHGPFSLADAFNYSTRPWE